MIHLGYRCGERSGGGSLGCFRSCQLSYVELSVVFYSMNDWDAIAAVKDLGMAEKSEVIVYLLT